MIYSLTDKIWIRIAKIIYLSVSYSSFFFKFFVIRCIFNLLLLDKDTFALFPPSNLQQFRLFREYQGTNINSASKNSTPINLWHIFCLLLFLENYLIFMSFLKIKIIFIIIVCCESLNIWKSRSLNASYFVLLFNSILFLLNFGIVAIFNTVI